MDEQVTSGTKCELCDTQLTWDMGGRRFEFTAHTAEFCRRMTLYRIDLLQQVLQQHVETCQHHLEYARRRIDHWLEERGLETLKVWTERASREAEIKMRIDNARLGLGLNLDVEVLRG